jgi:hypothetical protein
MGLHLMWRAEETRVVLRFLGGVAVCLRAPELPEAFARSYADLDVITTRSNRHAGRRSQNRRRPGCRCLRVAVRLSERQRRCFWFGLPLGHNARAGEHLRGRSNEETSKPFVPRWTARRGDIGSKRKPGLACSRLRIPLGHGSRRQQRYSAQPDGLTLREGAQPSVAPTCASELSGLRSGSPRAEHPSIRGPCASSEAVSDQEGSGAGVRDFERPVQALASA